MLETGQGHYNKGCIYTNECGLGCLILYDWHSPTEYVMSYDELLTPNFDIIRWRYIQKSYYFNELVQKKRKMKWAGPMVPVVISSTKSDDDSGNDCLGSNNTCEESGVSSDGWLNCDKIYLLRESLQETLLDDNYHPGVLRLGAVGVSPKASSSSKLEWSALWVKGMNPSLIPKPMVVMIKVVGQPCQALLDTGLLGDFVLTTPADQLRLKASELKEPLTLQLAISGSWGKVKHYMDMSFEYQDIWEKCTFHIVNLDSHDVILGLLFMIQHSMVIGFNPSQVMIWSDAAWDLPHEQSWNLSSYFVNFKNMNISLLREELTEYAYAQNIC